MKRQGLAITSFLGISILGLGLILGGNGCGSSPSSPGPSPSETPGHYSTTAVTIYSGPSTFYPMGLAYSSTSGNLWVTNQGKNSLEEYTTAGTPVTSIINTTSGSATLQFVEGASVGPDGTVYVADNGNNEIYVYTSAGSYETSLSATAIESMVVSSGGTTLFIESQTSPGTIYEYSITGTAPEVFNYLGLITSTSSGVGLLTNPGFMTLDGGGNVIVANYGGSNIVKYNGSGPVSFGSADLTKPEGVVVDGAGNVLVSHDANSGFIQEFTPSGSTFAAGVTFGNGVLSNPCGLALDGSGNLYVANRGGNQILKYAYIH